MVISVSQQSCSLASKERQGSKDCQFAAGVKSRNIEWTNAQETSHALSSGKIIQPTLQDTNPARAEPGERSGRLRRASAGSELPRKAKPRFGAVLNCTVSSGVVGSDCTYNDPVLASAACRDRHTPLAFGNVTDAPVLFTLPRVGGQAAGAEWSGASPTAWGCPCTSSRPF